MPASPDRHFSNAVRPGRLPSIDRVIDSALRKHAFVSLGEDRQIGRLGLQLGTERTAALAVGTVARGAFRQKFHPACIEVLRPSGITQRECDIRTQQPARDSNSGHALRDHLAKLFDGHRRMLITARPIARAHPARGSVQLHIAARKVESVLLQDRDLMGLFDLFVGKRSGRHSV